MQKENVFLFLTISVIFVTNTVAKGGRGGGGRSGGGRSGGKSSSSGGGGRWGFFGGSSKSGSSGSKIGSGSADYSNNGGWFHGFFHSSPHYTYSPMYISRTYYVPGAIQRSTYKEDEAKDSFKNYAGENTDVPDYSIKDTNNYAVGYTISKALSNDFFSIFNLVDDLSHYPEKIKNKEFVTSKPTATTSTSTTIATTTTDASVSAFESYTVPFMQPGRNADYLDIQKNLEAFHTTETTLPRYEYSHLPVINPHEYLSLSSDELNKKINELLPKISY